MDTRYFKITAEKAGGRLDLAVLELLGPDFSRNQVQRLLKQGCITLEGRPARAAQKVSPGQAVAVALPPPEPAELIPEPLALDVLYEDGDLIVVNKAPGMVVHPAPGHASGTLVHALLHHCGDLAQVGGRLRPGIVHRLDKDTSGALVAAKNDQAHRRLAAAFASGRVDKQYLALVWGDPPPAGESRGGIGRHPVDRKRMSSHGRHTKPAHTRWRVTRRFAAAGMSLLRVDIFTGRTHQIRVHLSEAGYPVVGDPVYGGRRARRRPPDPLGGALARAGRQMLHAANLGLEHPLSGQRLEVVAALPEDFRLVLRACRRMDSPSRV
jgi:23S rRNA pseudouridine1911/1915/1917 synthase